MTLAKQDLSAKSDVPSQSKKLYAAPRLTSYGNVEQITEGTGLGTADSSGQNGRYTIG